MPDDTEAGGAGDEAARAAHEEPIGAEAGAPEPVGERQEVRAVHRVPVQQDDGPRAARARAGQRQEAGGARGRERQGDGPLAERDADGVRGLAAAADRSRRASARRQDDRAQQMRQQRVDAAEHQRMGDGGHAAAPEQVPHGVPSLHGGAAR